jgi:catechol 2,3-dioxygenase-like lactoylglutathione lyase family enzyme
MIKVNEIAFVACPVTDKQRARDFYEGILGLTPTMNTDFPEGFWLEYDIGSGTLALSNFWKASSRPDEPGPSIGLEVENYEEAVAALKAKSVPFNIEKMDTPICQFSLVQDPDGNTLFIHKRKPGHS